MRQVLHRRLTHEHASEADTLVLDELGLCGRVRVDVAVVNGLLTGYELKSARDTLRRLPTQVEVYSQVLDRAHLVVAASHRADALTYLPDWWGVQVAVSRNDTVELETEREGTQNRSIVKMALAQLLWREEALVELVDRQADRGVRSKPRWAVWERLVDVTELDELRDLVRCRLKARQEWRAAP